jgi:hypothetical protein
MFPVRYELGFISQKTRQCLRTFKTDVKFFSLPPLWCLSLTPTPLSFLHSLHSHRRENLKTNTTPTALVSVLGWQCVAEDVFNYDRHRSLLYIADVRKP